VLGHLVRLGLLVERPVASGWIPAAFGSKPEVLVPLVHLDRPEVAKYIIFEF
jgi:hypothetical protein